jgi:hypothetical protein
MIGDDVELLARHVKDGAGKQGHALPRLLAFPLAYHGGAPRSRPDARGVAGGPGLNLIHIILETF